MPHIVIYETTHFENISTLVRLFGQPGTRVTVFCTEASRKLSLQMDRLEAVNVEWHTDGPHGSRSAFLRFMYRWLDPDQTDLLLINTASDHYWQLAAICRKMRHRRVVLTIHAVQAYFSPQLKFNLRRIVRVTGKWMLRRSIHQYTIQSRAMLPAVRRSLPAAVPVYWLPGACRVSSEKNEALPDFPLHIVIAGSVDPRRRRYDELLEWIGEVKTPLRLTLLGGMKGSEGIQLIKQLQHVKSSMLELRYYDTDTIDQTEYDAVLSKAHFIYNPSPKETVLEDGAVEIYGDTVQSGVFADAVRHALPLIIPNGLAVDPAFQSACFRYQTARDLLSFFNSQQQHSYELNWKKSAIEMAEHFQIGLIRAYTPALFTIK